MRPTRATYLAFLTWWKYGSTRPESITPPGAPSPVHLNPDDRRALKKLVHASARNRLSVPIRFWRSMVASLQPDLALDIGANYGECFAGATYPQRTRILALEANPGLIPYLEKTRRAHAAADHMKVVHCLVGDQPAPPRPFFFDPEWTGMGSALEPADAQKRQQILVAVDSVDEILRREFGPVAGRTLLLKMDVEGYEGMVLRGFRTLEAFQEVAGIMEFDTLWLGRAGTPAREVFERLASLGRVFDTVRHQSVLKPARNWSDLAARHGDGDFHTDLVFVSRETALPSGWQVTAH
jgi:FkbM family methyltransferase